MAIRELLSFHVPITLCASHPIESSRIHRKVLYRIPSHPKQAKSSTNKANQSIALHRIHHAARSTPSRNQNQKAGPAQLLNDCKRNQVECCVLLERKKGVIGRREEEERRKERKNRSE
jgi:hypothetical protein